MSGFVSTVDAQAEASSAQAWEVPRTSDGHPNLQGNWTNVTLTPFQRREGRGPVFTWEEVRDIENVTDECPANPGTVACGRRELQGQSNEARLTGQEYNEVYWDRGSRIAIVNGEPRTSLVTRPSNGRRPPLTSEARERIQEAREFRSQFGQYDHPELRPLGRTVCRVFRFKRWASNDSEYGVQQQLYDRAKCRLCDDRSRDGSRRKDHPVG